MKGVSSTKVTGKSVARASENTSSLAEWGRAQRRKTGGRRVGWYGNGLNQGTGGIEAVGYECPKPEINRKEKVENRPSWSVTAPGLGQVGEDHDYSRGTEKDQPEIRSLLGAAPRGKACRVEKACATRRKPEAGVDWWRQTQGRHGWDTRGDSVSGPWRGAANLRGGSEEKGHHAAKVKRVGELEPIEGGEGSEGKETIWLSYTIMMGVEKMEKDTGKKCRGKSAHRIRVK